MLTNKRKEKISAFLDNDMHSDELMSFSLSGEADDAETARRYQMVGDALRGEMSDSSFVDVSHAVREALLDEESYTSTSNMSQQSSVKTAADNRSSFGLSAWFRPVAGMAVAATVAVVMVVTLSEQDNGSGISPVATEVITQPAVQVAVEDKASQKSGQSVDQNLINQHLEYATQDTLQGRLPLVRAVSYEAEK